MPWKRTRAVVAELLIGVDDDLGIRMGLETVSLRLELVAQLAEVVDLAVVDDLDRPVLVSDRLIPTTRHR
jgi:hypothetical protein